MYRVDDGNFKVEALSSRHKRARIIVAYFLFVYMNNCLLSSGSGVRVSYGLLHFLLQVNIVRRGNHIKPHYRDKNCHKKDCNLISKFHLNFLSQFISFNYIYVTQTKRFPIDYIYIIGNIK